MYTITEFTLYVQVNWFYEKCRYFKTLLAHFLEYKPDPRAMEQARAMEHARSQGLDVRGQGLDHGRGEGLDHGRGEGLEHIRGDGLDPGSHMDHHIHHQQQHEKVDNRKNIHWLQSYRKKGPEFQLVLY